jgi:DNA mismatch repair ATPase MutS
LSSFHHIDSLEESTSYFYAELKCLQEIIQSLSGPVPALVLLDEVMRGTNSKDKHDGTALLIKKILQFDCLSFIATHDTELGILSESYPGAVENFCFESELTDAGLHFDFTMRKGVAQTKNATYLMQQMGII